MREKGVIVEWGLVKKEVLEKKEGQDIILLFQRQQ